MAWLLTRPHEMHSCDAAQSYAWAPAEDAELKAAITRWSIAMVYALKGHLWALRDLSKGLQVRHGWYASSALFRGDNQAVVRSKGCRR
jgi:hypothetical protein